MRAVVVERYGPPEVARVRERPDPEPRAGEVLVRVHATTVNSGDARIRGAHFPPGFAAPARLALGIRGPRRPILGTAFAGEVIALGAGVVAPTVGTRVAGMAGMRMGGHAELLAVPADRAIAIPDGVDTDTAAALMFGGTTALDYLHRKAALAPGHRVLIVGASGSVGTAAVQLAALGGAHVTAVTSAANAELVTRLGAADVIDYRATPLAGLGARFDIILDAVGTLSPATARPLLAPGGVILLAVASLGQTITAHGNVIAGPASENPHDVAQLLALAAERALDPVITAVLPLDQIGEAHRIVDSGRKVGNLVVRPGE